MEGCLVGSTDSDNIFRMYFTLKYTVDTAQHVKFELSCYASVDVHPPTLPADLADIQATIIQEVRPETPPPTTQTTTASTHQTLPGSYSETPVQ